MSDKCFCHLTINGESFEVKDAKARQDIEKTNNVNANYYDEVKYRFLRKDNTNYYLIDIPKYDSTGKLINIYVSERGEGLSPNEDAIKNNTNVTINGSLAVVQDDGTYIDTTAIGNGVILKDYQMSSLDDEYQYLGIKEDNTITSYQANSTTPAQMLADGVKNAFLVFGQSVKNGVYSGLSHYLTAGPGQYIGQKQNGDIVILTNDGRNNDNAGFTGEQGSQILIDEGCVNVWILDGGGSTSTSFKGCKLNMNVDDNGRTDRNISYLLNVKKEINNKQVADVYSFIGQMKQMIMAQLRPMIDNKQNHIMMERLNWKNALIINSNEYLFTWNTGSPSEQGITYDSETGLIKLPEIEGICRISFIANVNNGASSDVELNVGVKYSRTSTSNELSLNKTIKANSNDIVSFSEIFNCGVGASVNIFASAPSNLTFTNSRCCIEYIPYTYEKVE